MIQDQVKDYYGKELQGSQDLKTNACCTDASLPAHVKKALANVHDEVLARYYGCGLIAPEALEGCRILDLGSGSGRDAYVLAQLVGEKGEIVGVDMTPEQLTIARKYDEWHRERFGYKQSNVSFIEGELEKLLDLGLEEGSFDVIVSNCVINLCSDKEAVMRAAKTLLKPGGEIYFSDVYSDRRIPENLQKDPVLYGECLSGALYVNDFENLVRKIGFTDPRMTDSRRLTIDNPQIEKAVDGYKFYSVGYRLFNLTDLEPHCEDYGQSVVYKGTVTTTPTTFILDDHHTIQQGEEYAVCGNTYRMLNESRFVEHFDFQGDFSEHKGIFPGCGGALSATESCCPTGAELSDSCCSSSTEESSCCTPSSHEESSCCTPDPKESSCCEPAVKKKSPAAKIITKNLDEVWFHTGTNCNLSCTGCLEGAHPGDGRIGMITFDEAKPLIDEAVLLGVKQFSFTGGEPFVNPDMIQILSYALNKLPCLVLTNGTHPFQKAFEDIVKLQKKPHSLSFRISLDHHSAEAHDAIRGNGKFEQALQSIKMLDEAGIICSIARHQEEHESSFGIEELYRTVLNDAEINTDKRFVSFPDLLPPNSHPDGIPTITESCLEVFDGTPGFMCESSRMILKKGNSVGVYACTLVDDDESYNFGQSLKESLDTSVHLTHHRCFSCYKNGASCSEL